ncbi:MAG: hypothetical protein HY923_01840 [Elusimicrobia bacterium]|nr:hypothetical protein [Elusimicrobiota bacterium]
MAKTPRLLLLLTFALAPRAALAQKEFSDCRMGHVVLLLPGEKPPKGPGCGGVTATIDLAVASALADRAAAMAAENAKKLAEPEASAIGAISSPYANEVLTEDATVAKRVGEKELVWQTVHDKLVAAKTEVKKLSEEDEEPSGERVKELNALATRIAAGAAILKDIAADKARFKAFMALDKKAETDAAVLKRKAALFAKIAPPKKA